MRIRSGYDSAVPQAPPIPVVVILGAGASFASGDFPAGIAPSLTANLFDNDRTSEFIHEYPLAQMAGRAIKRSQNGDTPVPLEEALLSLRTSPNPQRRLMAQTVPLFLQDLLLRTSSDLYHQAFRYDALIDLLSDLPKVHYITLNYDVLLDSRLHQFHPLMSFDDYVDPSNQWSLIKLHGSVNWSYRTDSSFDPFRPPLELSIVRSAMECEPPTQFNLEQLRFAGPDGYIRRYPAIALPEGPKDQLMAPTSHTEFLAQSLRSSRVIDVIVAGYSALDTEVLALLKGSGAQIRRLTVVNRDPVAALEVWRVIEGQELDIVWPDIYDGSFADWIDRGGTRNWVAEFGGPYRTVRDPGDLRTALATRDQAREADEIRWRARTAEEALPPLPDQW
jgi:hypothetical protein